MVSVDDRSTDKRSSEWKRESVSDKDEKEKVFFGQYSIVLSLPVYVDLA